MATDEVLLFANNEGEEVSAIQLGNPAADDLVELFAPSGIPEAIVGTIPSDNDWLVKMPDGVTILRVPNVYFEREYLGV